MRKIVLMALAFAAFAATGAFAQEPVHPAYLHALSDLRAARWMIEHRPGNWAQVDDEKAAVKKIDDAIAEIKKCAIDDGKDINDHPAAQEINEHKGRLGKAEEWLHKAHADIDKEDEVYQHGLKKKALAHIDEAISHVKKAEQGF